MRAIWITRHGGPEALEVRETADPEPGPGQVRIRVSAAGLNFADVMAAQGLYPDAPKPPMAGMCPFYGVSAWLSARVLPVDGAVVHVLTGLMAHRPAPGRAFPGRRRGANRVLRDRTGVLT